MSHLFDKYVDVPDRFALWSRFIVDNNLCRVAEIGVYRGDFAARVLACAPVVQAYIMIDPWRFMPSWNKPANTNDEVFEAYYEKAMSVTRFAADKRVVLRGTTSEVANRIPDDSLDFVYIDGDHTLKGISIDLISIYGKVRDGGWIAGDDFCDSIWQHPKQFEPTMVFPFTIYFAEAHGLTVYGLPHNQFAIHKHQSGFKFHDLTGTFGDTSILRQLLPS